MYTEYNILVEGDIYNSGNYTYPITASGLVSLYDGSTSSSAFTIPADEVVSFCVEFGEAVHVDHINYYVSPLNISDVSISYGVDNSNLTSVSVVSSGTYLYGGIADYVSYLYVTHSGSVDSSVFQLEALSTAVQCASSSGFSSGAVGAPVGVEGGSVFTTIVSNTCTLDKTIGVAVSPYNDDGVSFSISVDGGLFYGENEHGVHQPVHIPLTTPSNSLSSSTINSFYSDWYKSFSNRAYVVSEDDYLKLVVQYDGVGSGRKTSPWNEYACSFFVSNDSFTLDQSFTLSLEIAVLSAPFENLTDDDEASWTTNKFMLGFTDSYLVSDDAPRNTELDSMLLDLPRRSLAAVWLGARKYVGDATDLYVGGLVSDGDFSFYTGYNDLDDDKGTSGLDVYAPVISSVGLEYLSENVYKESSYEDGSSDAPWRRLWVTYDHRVRKVTFYLDGIELSDYSFSSSSLFDKFHLFFGFDGVGGFEVAIKNLEVHTGVLYKHTQAIQTISTDCAVATYPPDDFLIDGRFSDSNYNYAWVGAATGLGEYTFSASLSDEYPIDFMRLIKPNSGDSITVSGSVYSSAKYSVNKVTLEFDTGDIRYAYFSDDTSSGLNSWDVSYLSTISGTIEPVVGAKAVQGTFDSFHERSSGENVFVIDQLFLGSVSGTLSVGSSSLTTSGIPWERGYGYNVVYGKNGVVSQAYTDVYDVTTREDCYNLIYGADYGANNIVFDSSNYYNLYHYGESVFKREQSYDTGRHEGLSTVANAGYAYIWRKFDAEFSIKGVYFAFMSNPQTGTYFRGKPDKWKLQYLKKNGDVSVDSDWVDIPVLSSPYGSSGDYYTYTSYLVSHNDGEFYTTYINSMDSTGNVSLPSDVLCAKNRFNSITELEALSGVTSSCYIEFNTSVTTQAIRLVIEDGYNDTSRTEKATGYMFTDFVCYSDTSVGVYVSPVVDTGSEFNTERVWASSSTVSGSVSLVYRAKDTPPTFGYVSSSNKWYDLGVPFAGLDSEYSGSFSSSVALIPYNDTIYFIDGDVGKLVLYNTTTGKWSYGDYLPTETTGESIVPDVRTRNPVALFGDVIVVATQSTDGSSSNSGLYKYYISDNAYSYQGWESYPYQRQPEAVNAAFIGDGTRYGYFLAVDGTITVFDIEDGSLDTEDREYVPLHGASSRSDYVPAYYNGKLYVCGGSNCGSKLDIYDIENDEWSSGPDLPFEIQYAFSVYSNGYIYVLSYYPASRFSPYVRFNLQTQSWEQLGTLSYNNQTSYLAFNYGGFGSQPVINSYVASGNYIYGFSTAYGDFRRILTKETDWVHGMLPSRHDSSWSDTMAWTPVVEGSENLPQSRYIQYKMILTTEEEEPVTEIEEVVVVTPQETTIMGGGSTQIGVKTDIAGDAVVSFWRCCVGDTNSPYILFGRSKNIFAGSIVKDKFSFTVSAGGYTYATLDFCLLDQYTGYISYGTYSNRAVTSSVIKRVTSTDGVDWTIDSTVVSTGIVGSADSDAVSAPCVLDVSGTKHMWYTGESSSGVYSILHAVSTDSVTWTSHQVSLPSGSYLLGDYTDINGARHPSVVEIDGVFYMIYEAVSSTYVSSLLYAQSTDGVTWSSIRPVVTPDVGSYTSPMLVYDHGVFRLWFLYKNGKYSEVWYGESGSPDSWEVERIEGTNPYGYFDNPEITDIFVTVSRPTFDTNTIIDADIKIYER